MEEVSNRVPRTADGQIIYPMMPAFLCQPYCTEKCRKVTIAYVESYQTFSEKNEYWCVIDENRGYGEDGYDTGNTEHVSGLFADEAECLRVANEKWLIFGAEQAARESQKEALQKKKNIK